VHEARNGLQAAVGWVDTRGCVCSCLFFCLCQLIQWHSLVVEVVYAHLLPLHAVVCFATDVLLQPCVWHGAPIGYWNFGPLGTQEK
jgi:hypothetical protein